jgi:hypothetical protein
MSWNRSLKEQETHHIINGAENALCFTILRRSVWTRHLHNHPISEEECMRGNIFEPMAIVALDEYGGATKLCEDISKEI